MNEKTQHKISDNSEEELVKEIAVSTDNSIKHKKLEEVELHGSQTTSRSTYESFFWFLSYAKMFTYRLIKDLVITLLGFVYSGQILPNHILDLMSLQNNFESKNGPDTVTCSSSRTQQDSTLQLSLSKYINAFKTYVLCSEDDIGLGCGPTRDLPIHPVDREPFFFIVDSNCVELSESSLDVYIPSYPGSPRSLHFGSDISLESLDETDPRLKQAVNFLHQETDFLMAAEIGDDRMLEILISKQVNRQQIDHLGRNALHFAVCCDNEYAVLLLLKVGVNPNVKDNLGMTPLSLCLMRRPSLNVVKLLFNYGAKILPRSCPMDTGLFLQFVMMCKPTIEEEKILRYLIDQGAIVTDAEAPGGRQALHFAAMSNNCHLINILMNLGADLFVTNHRNETPKAVATIFKCRNALALLEQLEDDYIQNINEADAVVHP